MLSFRARGILAYLQANPEAPTNASHLSSVAAEGYGAIRNALEELADAGLLERRKTQAIRTGHWKTRLYRTPALAAWSHSA